MLALLNKKAQALLILQFVNVIFVCTACCAKRMWKMVMSVHEITNSALLNMNFNMKLSETKFCICSNMMSCCHVGFADGN